MQIEKSNQQIVGIINQKYFSQFLLNVQQRQERNFKALQNLFFANDDFLHARPRMIPKFPQIHPRFHNILDMKNVLRIMLRCDSICSRKN